MPLIAIRDGKKCREANREDKRRKSNVAQECVKLTLPILHPKQCDCTTKITLDFPVSCTRLASFSARYLRWRHLTVKSAIYFWLCCRTVVPQLSKQLILQMIHHSELLRLDKYPFYYKIPVTIFRPHMTYQTRISIKKVE